MWNDNTMEGGNLYHAHVITSKQTKRVEQLISDCLRLTEGIRISKIYDYLLSIILVTVCIENVCHSVIMVVY